MKKIIPLLLFLMIGLVSANVNSVSGLVINDDDYFLTYGTTYDWNVTVNMSTIWNNASCTINGNAMTNVSNSSGTVGVYRVQATPETLYSTFDDNCTYITVTVNCTDLGNSSSSDTTTLTNVTMLPCVESCNVTMSAVSASASTLSMTLNDSTASSTVTWIVPESYNTTHGQCNYEVSNNEKATTSAMTVNLTSATPYCILTIVRDTDDTGVMVAQVESLLSITQPSSIPAAAIAGLTVIIIFSHIVATRVTT